MTDEFGKIAFGDQYKIRTMSRLYALAKCVIKEEAIVSFFSTPHELLQGKTIFETCLTDAGYDRVEEILAGAYYGLPL